MRNIALWLALATVVSSQAMMDTKKISLVSKIKTPKISLTPDTKKFKMHAFHTSPNTSKYHGDYKKVGLLVAGIKKHKMHYFDPKDIRVVQNGIGGANIGFAIGWFGTNIICHGVIFVGCRAVDLVAPGIGAAAETGIHAAAAPYIAGAAKVIACGTGIAGGAATGPL